MKSLRMHVLLFGLMLLQLPGLSQDILEQRVERYLFSSYDANKSGLKENERIISFLEQKLDDYVFSLKKEELNQLKAQEKEFNAFLDRIEGIKDIKMMQQMVHDSKKSHSLLTAKVLEEGIRSMEEAQECKKIIVFKLMEIEILKMKHEKLLVLLKDDYNRNQFIEGLLSTGKISEKTDTRSLITTVDMSLAELTI